MFQGQSARPKHWFDLDIEWAEEIFSTREPRFYKRLFIINIEGQSGITYPLFTVPIRNEKEIGEIEYNFQDPLVVYHKNASNTCCFSSLTSAFTASGERNSAREIVMIIEE